MLTLVVSDVLNGYARDLRSPEIGLVHETPQRPLWVRKGRSSDPTGSRPGPLRWCPLLSPRSRQTKGVVITILPKTKKRVRPPYILKSQSSPDPST